jgi:hypothetical protein
MLGSNQEPNKPLPPSPNRVKIFIQTLIASFFVLYVGLVWFNPVSTKMISGGESIIPPVSPTAPVYDMHFGEPPF